MTDRRRFRRHYADAPDREAVLRELRRERRRKRRRHRRVATALILILALAAGFFAADRLLLMVAVRGSGMSPLLESDNVVVCLRDGSPLALPAPARGDVVLLAYEGKLLVKRVIGVGGDEILLDEDGQVFVNGEALREDYVSSPGGGSDVVYPLAVPEGELFVMGDHRAMAVDSRSRVFGTVPVDSVAGRVALVVWPVFDVKWLGLPGRDSAAAATDEATE